MAMFIKTDYDPGKEEVKVRTESYTDGNLAILLVCADTHELFATLTTNIITMPPFHAAVDTNNLPHAEEFINEYKLGKNTGRTIQSGFCEYPVYDFTDIVVAAAKHA